MDFNDTSDEAIWREKCRVWLEGNVPKLANSPSDIVSRAKAWHALRFDGGFAKIAWGPEHGGRNGSVMEQIIFNQEEAKFDVPGDYFRIGLSFIAPTLRTHGTEQQKERYLVKLLRGEEIWCQLFSEPGAGSDLASLATSAIFDGKDWVLNGQKVWTSLAHVADFGEILCRTNPDVPKHAGITAFILDMKAPGVTVRPLRQMTGASDFNEVFLTDVRVPENAVIGTVDRGWQVAVATLANERNWSTGGGGLTSSARELADLADRRGRMDPVIRQQLAKLWIHGEILRYLGMRTLTAASKGLTPGPEGSVAKLAYANFGVEVGNVATSILGPSATAACDDGAEWLHRLFLAAGHRIGGGTDEINRNIVAERVLGLPREPRTDSHVVWREHRR